MRTTPPVVNYDELDPGIRETVRWLQNQGFHTVDSGDGISKSETYAEDEYLPFPHVAILTTPSSLVGTANRLRSCLEQAGFSFDSADPSVGPFIEATYSPNDGTAVVLLSNVSDALWEAQKTAPVQDDPNFGYCARCDKEAVLTPKDGYCPACEKTDKCPTCTGSGEVESGRICSRCNGCCDTIPCPDCKGHTKE